MSHERKDPVLRSQTCFKVIGGVWVIMGGLEKEEVFFGGLTCFQVRTGNIFPVLVSLSLSGDGGNTWRGRVFGIGRLEKMNGPSKEGSRGYRLFLKNLGFGFALVIFGIKRGWVVDQDWGAVGVGCGVCFEIVA
jgi:hypothetical protein